ncbi:acyltransferase family protein [Buttiauxella agrestis]|uniref:O-antigen acetylase n=1 Tax=Buttiauxella agrestis ATCC 33320 TaxID=1006004 RepID=A0A085GD63_9ENTR|nr:acyltransferase family protein [Buttiauxella agrestis]KFC81658.1 O-antigen acetylase [Buttiauxella agrestis ATCC 33320]
MLKYRKELDGLRCLAVMAVIIYHAGISLFGIKLFKGGFFGVDVFLVLSGYLITDIIINKLDSNAFSLLDFFWRRIKRILPALIAMLSVTSVAAYFILLPNDLIKFSESLRSALYFGSNYYFLGEDSYVSNASIFKPLLHTWSLAVEWQFYIFYPFVLLFINRFFKKYRVSLLLSLAIISIFYANYIVPNYPDLAFYTLPPRAWELVLGGLMSFISIRKYGNLSLSGPGGIACKTLPTLGMFMVLYAMMFIDSHVQHPSFITLLPVIGTCLIIAFANDDDIVTAALSLRPVVFIGAISYSLYLWHQPVFVFFRFMRHEYVTLKDFAGLTLLSLALAYASYRFIESPFRGRDVKKFSVTALAAFASLIIAFSFATQKYEGFPNRLQGLVKETYEMYKEPEFRRMSDSSQPGNNILTGEQVYACGLRSLDNPCKYGDESWVTIGDSFAGQYEYALQESLSKDGKGLMSLAYEQCPFLTNMWFGNTPECTVVNEQRWKQIENLHSKKNILVAVNYDFFPGIKAGVSNPLEMGRQKFSGGVLIGDDEAWKSYAENIKKLIALGHDVYVIYPAPAPTEDVGKLVFSQLRNIGYKFHTQYTSTPGVYDAVLERSAKIDAYLPNMPGLHKIRPADALCEKGKCKIIDSNGGLFNGGSHLSYSGVKEVLGLIH